MSTVTTPANAAVKAARKLLRRHGRDHSDQFLVEGPAIAEALPWLQRLFVTPTGLETHGWLKEAADRAGVQVTVVDDAVLAGLADTVTSQGALGVAQMARPSLQSLADVLTASDTKRVLVADGVADPGNAGTLIRTAAAAGMDGVIFTSGSVDPRNPKTVRATAGSLFHLPVVDRVEPVDLITMCATVGVRLIGASADAAALHWDVDLAARCALVVGNEAHGLSPVLADALDEVVAIRMTEAAESLNVAVSAGILMYESVRQLHAVETGQ